MASDAPIGIFDSGIGGLSVWREIHALLPAEDTVYFADQLHCPYGPQAPERILELCIANTELLLSHNCKLIVLACNTATAAAVEELRKRYAVPFVGMEPAVKPAALGSRNHKVGILATRGTLRGGHYKRTSGRFADVAQFVVHEVEGWVELVESGQTQCTPEVLSIVRRELAPLLEVGVDSIVLGCTHFPFLREAIELVAGPGVTIYDPAPAVARRVRQLLLDGGIDAPLGRTGHCEFFSNADGKLSSLQFNPHLSSFITPV